jgi:hypothetical protein
MLSKNFGWPFILVFIGLGCGGRTANPVMISQPEDSVLTCPQIEVEMGQIMPQIAALYSEGKKGRKKNKVYEALTFIPIPGLQVFALFKDYRHAEKVEINALRKRHNHLVSMARENGCGENKLMIPYKEHCKDFFTLGCIAPNGKK